jgi:hypothetical protein
MPYDDSRLGAEARVVQLDIAGERIAMTRTGGGWWTFDIRWRVPARAQAPCGFESRPSTNNNLSLP